MPSCAVMPCGAANRSSNIAINSFVFIALIFIIFYFYAQMYKKIFVLQIYSP